MEERKKEPSLASVPTTERGGRGEFPEMKSLNVIIVTPYLLIPLPLQFQEFFIDWDRVFKLLSPHSCSIRGAHPCWDRATKRGNLFC